MYSAVVLCLLVYSFIPKKNILVPGFDQIFYFRVGRSEEIFFNSFIFLKELVLLSSVALSSCHRLKLCQLLSTGIPTCRLPGENLLYPIMDYPMDLQ